VKCEFLINDLEPSLSNLIINGELINVAMKLSVFIRLWELKFFIPEPEMGVVNSGECLRLELAMIGVTNLLLLAENLATLYLLVLLYEE